MGPEKFLTKEEILALIPNAEGGVVARELSDEEGIYLLDVRFEGEKPGEVTEYSYARKGSWTESKSVATRIDIAYYEDEVPMGGKSFARFDEGSKEWKMIT